MDLKLKRGKQVFRALLGAVKASREEQVPLAHVRIYKIYKIYKHNTETHMSEYVHIRTIFYMCM